MKRIDSNSIGAALLALCMLAGCGSSPGKPAPGPEVPRPDQVLDFPTLYGQNCAACHGRQGKNGAAISLNNPVYLAIAGSATIQNITANGVPGTSMPPFAKSSGGTLTSRQIAALASGMLSSWGNASAAAGQTPPPYAAGATGDAAQGAKAFTAFCARCHGADGAGASANGVTTGSLVDPSYLALISNQGLRSFILAGQTEQGPHNWRSYTQTPVTGQQITDIVAWLASHRSTSPGQVYTQHP